MARARGIKPGFFRNADLVELPFEARLLFIGLWTLADRAGRLEDRPKQIKMEVFPADNIDCDALLDMIAQTGMLVRYEVDGKRYLQVVNFAKHQNPHRDERVSTIPNQCGHCDGTAPIPDKHGASTVQARCGNGANTVGIGLTPDSGLLTPDSPILGGVAREAPPSPDGSPPPFLPEYREFIAAERPDLDPEPVFKNFCDHYPADKRTAANWRKWVRREIPSLKARDSPDSGVSDPESRASIEALGLSLGLGRWDELKEHWTSYKNRVKGVPA